MIVKNKTYKGTRILVGNGKRRMINDMVSILLEEGFTEISLPIIYHEELFEDRVGDNNRMMFLLSDRGGRALCLAPEYTTIIQELALDTFKYRKDYRLFYVAECFRGEHPQKGRLRQFTQLGVEVLNPTQDYTSYLTGLGKKMLNLPNLEVRSEERAMEFYTGTGFEIHAPEAGSASQLLGGGPYKGGIGFAIGVDRVFDLFGYPEKIDE